MCKTRAFGDFSFSSWNVDFVQVSESRPAEVETRGNWPLQRSCPFSPPRRVLLSQKGNHSHTYAQEVECGEPPLHRSLGAHPDWQGWANLSFTGISSRQFSLLSHMSVHAHHQNRNQFWGRLMQGLPHKLDLWMSETQVNNWLQTAFRLHKKGLHQRQRKQALDDTCFVLAVEFSDAERSSSSSSCCWHFGRFCRSFWHPPGPSRRWSPCTARQTTSPSSPTRTSLPSSTPTGSGSSSSTRTGAATAKGSCQRGWKWPIHSQVRIRQKKYSSQWSYVIAIWKWLVFKTSPRSLRPSPVPVTIITLPLCNEGIFIGLSRLILLPVGYLNLGFLEPGLSPHYGLDNTAKSMILTQDRAVLQVQRYLNRTFLYFRHPYKYFQHKSIQSVTQVRLIWVKKHLFHNSLLISKKSFKKGTMLDQFCSYHHQSIQSVLNTDRIFHDFL